MKAVYLVSLGCPKNLVDSEVMLGLLEQAGYMPVQEPESADLLLVNTCGFIGSAVEEAIDEILALAKYKKEDPAKILVVTGCLVQRYGGDLRQGLPEVDLFIGTDGFQDIVNLLDDLQTSAAARLTVTKPLFLMDSTAPRKISTPSHRAYLKITEGCANRCSYCLIPSIRGPLRSRPIPDLRSETARLAASGVKEITLIAQDLLAYAQDMKGQADLKTLLAELLASCAVPWFRLLYLHPARLDRDFLSFMAANQRVLPYLDIPLQHISDRILKLMSRPYGRAQVERLLEDIREILPQAVIRTTIMVGFPGETEKDMQELLELLSIHRFDHVGVFTYSNEEGCKAATLPDQCDEEVKEERYRRIMELQADISSARQQLYVGRKERVLVEGLSRETDLLLEGRTWFQAPNIDGCVYITSGTSRPGAFVEVKITDAHVYDLVGEIVGS